MTKYIYCIFFCILFTHFMAPKAYAWGPDQHGRTTHTLISLYAAEHASLEKYLEDCGISSGLDSRLTWDVNNDGSISASENISVVKWLSDVGAKLEDGKAREVNHFHNPITNSGLFGIWKSAIIWAQDSTAQANWTQPVDQTYCPPICFQDPSTSSDWSWQTTRNYFYAAVTTTDQKDREKNFAKMFRGLGQQMHLLQDMSVPSHVRNDAHLINQGIETWAANTITGIGRLKKFFSENQLAPIAPSIMLREPVDYGGKSLVAVARLSDSNLYSGQSAIDINASTVGLAEWTNANFFSDDTVELSFFNNINKDMPYPNSASTNLQEYINGEALPSTKVSEDGVVDVGFWIQKLSSKGAIDVVHFAKPGYFSNVAGGNIYHRTFILDEACHEDYAAKLLPRAVGYSAALLNYFFRGDIEITLPDNGYYAMTLAGDTPGAQELAFNQVHLMAQNKNSEEMSEGTVELVVKYKLAQANPFQSDPVPTEGFYYMVVPEKNGAKSIPSSNPTELFFDLPTPLSIWATDVSLQVVYHGKLGSEEGAVAVGFKDIPEPTPVGLINDMDRVCINGSWYVAGSPEALAQVNSDVYDVYPHDVKNAYLRFSPVSNPQFAKSNDGMSISVGDVAAGNYKEALYLLTDNSFKMSSWDKFVPTDPNDHLEYFSFPSIDSAEGLIRQDAQKPLEECEKKGIDLKPGEPCVIQITPQFASHRQWIAWKAILYSNMSYPAGSACP